MSDKTFRLDTAIKQAVRWVKGLDWSNPRIVFSAIMLGIIPFVAKYFFFTGLALGLMLAIAVLWLLDKSPVFVRDLVLEYPMTSDLILSSLAVVTLGNWFGHGLTLGIGAISCGIALSHGLTKLKGSESKVILQAVSAA